MSIFGGAMRRSLPRLSLWIAPLVMTACAPEGPSGFVTNHLNPDEECVISPEIGSNTAVPQGLYDVSKGFNGSDGTCDSPYMLHLLVNSFLRPNNDVGLGRAEPNVLQLHSAEVRLMDIARQTILFDRFADEDGVLPNPFLVTTNASLFPTDGDEPSTAVANVETIPTAYAEQLDRFDGQQILAEVQIFGTTTGDVDVDLKPFIYTIRICDGCLTGCGGCYTGPDVNLDEVYGMGTCRDNASADGRVCLDQNCRCE
jgi:hypothetical protein